MAILETAIRNGKIRGFETQTKGITCFLGIPYAKAPEGELRWRSPERPENWDGVRVCDDFGMSCWQRDSSSAPFFRELVEKNPVAPRPLRMSEDCLSLNVWTPAESDRERLPVMVWFYGGGLQGGTSDDIIFDGEGLCGYGVVLVTVNYRTGVFGYFGLDELEEETEYHSSGNYGLQDQILSLRWVKENIAAFGGDSENITIFGCSGGGRSVQGVCCSPAARGLVKHAIIHSAGGLNPNYSLEYKALKARGREFMEYCGKTSLSQMRAIPAKELQETYEAFRKQFNITGDGYYLPVEMDEIVRQGGQADIDYILSTTMNEIKWPVREQVTVENFKDHVFGERTQIFGSICRPETDEQAMDYATWAEVYEMKGAQLAWAKLQAKSAKKPVYLASFDHPMPHSGLASHGDDQYYVFHTLRKFWFPTGKEDDDLSRMMMLRWTNFAKTGDPNAEGLVKWTQYTADSPLTMSFTTAADSCMKDKKVREIEELADVYIHWGENRK